MRGHSKYLCTIKGSWFEIFEKLARIKAGQHNRHFLVFKSKPGLDEYYLVVFVIPGTIEPDPGLRFKTELERLRIHHNSVFGKIDRRTLPYSNGR
ncbi:MAG TPA: hypothetical protein VGI82_00290 [Chitinophagaceae bacterium]|jgi:hypothetical protein